jgi:hypothetical protein
MASSSPETAEGITAQPRNIAARRSRIENGVLMIFYSCSGFVIKFDENTITGNSMQNNRCETLFMHLKS